MINFAPKASIRNLKSEDFVGAHFTFQVTHSTLAHSLRGNLVYDAGDPFYICCNIPKETRLGEGEYTRRISEFYLMQHKNGGRSDPRRYKSYDKYFNEERKKRLFEHWGAGSLLGAILGRGGDDDRADLLIKLEGESLLIDAHEWEITYPSEWYSECFRDNNKFKFVDGFYPDAAEAIRIFKLKASDDMFGERYFPLCVFELHEGVEDKLYEVGHLPKSSSGWIATDQHIFIGTRCKPGEMPDVIERCYELGGMVPVGLQWDW